MKKYFNSLLTKIYIAVFTAMLFSACTVSKKYHSNGFNISSVFSVSPKNKPLVHTNAARKNQATADRLQAVTQKNEQLNAVQIESEYQSFSNKNLFAKPLDTVFFPEKGKRHRQHRNIFIPHINNQDAFNLIAFKAHNKDDKSWRMFDHAFQLGKLTLIWLVAAIAILILLAAINANIGGASAILLLLLQAVLIYVPALLIGLGYLYFLLGSIVLAIGTATYKKAISTLGPEFKLRGDAVVMHARIPFVSKANTIKTGKRILKQYPNNYYGEWLQDVSKTLTEITTNRSDLTINNWKIVKSTGIVFSILLAIGIIAFIFV